MIKTYLNWQLPMNRMGFAIAMAASFGLTLLGVLVFIPPAMMEELMAGSAEDAASFPKHLQVILSVPWWLLVPAFYRRMVDLKLANLRANCLFIFTPSVLEVVLPHSVVMQFLTPLAVWGFLTLLLMVALLFMPSRQQ